MTGIFIRRWPFEDIDTQGEYYVTMKVEIRAASPGTSKISGKLPEAGRRQRRISLVVSEEAWPCEHFDLGLPLCERMHVCCYKPSQFGILCYAALGN